MTVTFYHNPRCSKSREVLRLLRERGIEPDVVEYLTSRPSTAELRRILGLLGMTPRQLMRAKEAREAGLDDSSISCDALISAMIANPIVIERPILVTRDAARLGRPPERVLEIVCGPRGRSVR